jgi:PD-(D/E)XK nuclease superfamily protein
MSAALQRNTSLTGDLTELEVALALTRAGYRVLRPLPTACRYDLAIDNEDGTLTRVQCKTGLLKDGRIVFRVYSVSGHRSEGRPYQGQVDAFGLYCDATRQTFLVPFALIPDHRVMVCLRLSPSKNGQRAGVHLADDLLISAGSTPHTPSPDPPPKT